MNFLGTKTKKIKRLVVTFPKKITETEFLETIQQFITNIKSSKFSEGKKRGKSTAFIQFYNSMNLKEFVEKYPQNKKFQEFTQNCIFSYSLIQKSYPVGIHNPKENTFEENKEFQIILDKIEKINQKRDTSEPDKMIKKIYEHNEKVKEKFKKPTPLLKDLQNNTTRAN
ncbi:hypothetical protein M0811_13425 [Anaeramoeba ignava]|uniref:UPF3 domain-containing protein n=1 Tax=Anaeramoeba ignava TaxID=1746090 RepID=A0A9Q0R548_ANAIG|nr:hypothetical protein M0811_13425 [Anaeramoeba ignava]